MSLFRLFLSFVKIGTILLGGGYVILPIMKSEFVEKHKLISEDELIDYFAISQSLPGIIAANISIFVGYKLRRNRGAVAALLGMTLAPFLSIVFLASIIAHFINTNIMQGIFWGVGIGVMVLIVSSVREMWDKAVVDRFSFLLFLLAFSCVLFLKISPAIIVVLSAIIGILYNFGGNKHNRNNVKGDKREV